MKVLTAPLTVVPVPFIRRRRFHVVGPATTPVPPATERLPRSHGSWLVGLLWGRGRTPEEEAARAEALAVKARHCSSTGWRFF